MVFVHKVTKRVTIQTTIFFSLNQKNIEKEEHSEEAIPMSGTLYAAGSFTISFDLSSLTDNIKT